MSSLSLDNEPQDERAQLRIPDLELPRDYEEHWQGMPEFAQKDLMPWQTVKIHFRNVNDRRDFAALLDQRITDKTQYLWYPKAEWAKVANKRYASPELNMPRYPVYIISKGRWESRLTSRALESIGVPYKIVVEPQEYENYAAVISPEKILQLPFSNLGQGSIPARNWVWEHSIGIGAERHWILDDNLGGFIRLCNNEKIRVGDGSCFSVVESFVDRYENVAISGLNYYFLAKRKQVIPPFYLNTRVYSCILIKNDLPYRWRGRYNEDTDLSLRALKDGWCTILMNAFLCEKAATMTMSGGNTEDLYQEDGRLQMAKSLVEQHPDVARVAWKFGRWQHHVNYSSFKRNKLILKPGAVVPAGIDDYGLTLKILDEVTILPKEEELLGLSID